MNPWDIVFWGAVVSLSAQFVMAKAKGNPEEARDAAEILFDAMAFVLYDPEQGNPLEALGMTRQVFATTIIDRAAEKPEGENEENKKV